MDFSETSEGIEVKTSSYRLFLERAGGFAARQVEIFGPGRLDRFDRPGEGPHPTCMHFDNMTVNNTFQLAHYGKINESVTASVDGSQLKLSGRLIPIIEGTSGSVSIEKVMRFEDDTYDVKVHLRFEDTGPIDFASVWWDVHDKWLRAMRSSAGVFMPLQVGIGDSCDDDLHKSFRPMTGMDRGAGVWMEMIGESASIMVALRSPLPDHLPAGGMKYWDGPDDADAGEGVSHGCINLDLINCELSGAEPLDIEDLQCAYRVFLSGPTVVRSTPRTEQD
tara:strand:- start:1579 stop:2412 length:834 start_codon:yes stop_codon:yes gene_type:complete